MSKMDQMQLAESTLDSIISKQFPAWVKDETTLFPATYKTQKERLLQDCRMLHDDTSLKFHFLSCISGVDYLDRFEVVYFIYSLENRWKLGLKVVLDRNKPEIDSVTSVWPTADWHERETYDMLGIEFLNHPDLKRIYLPEDFPGYPLRKDFIDVRPKRHRRVRSR